MELEITEVQIRVGGLIGSIIIDRQGHKARISVEERVIHDPAANRRITIEKKNSEVTVVWNPWIEKAKAMADLGDDEWQQFVCVETANAYDYAVELAPGADHTMTARIS